MHDTPVYFSTLAQISAGLLGLVFIAMSFNARIADQNENKLLLGLAHQTFADLLAALSVALLMLFPVRFNLGSAFIVIAGLGVLRVMRGLKLAIRAKRSEAAILLRYALSLCGYAGILSAGSLFLRNEDSPNAYLATGVCPLLLLISGSRSAWLLFVRGL